MRSSSVLRGQLVSIPTSRPTACCPISEAIARTRISNSGTCDSDTSHIRIAISCRSATSFFKLRKSKYPLVLAMVSASRDRFSAASERDVMLAASLATGSIAAAASLRSLTMNVSSSALSGVSASGVVPQSSSPGVAPIIAAMSSAVSDCGPPISPVIAPMSRTCGCMGSLATRSGSCGTCSIGATLAGAIIAGSTGVLADGAAIACVGSSAAIGSAISAVGSRSSETAGSTIASPAASAEGPCISTARSLIVCNARLNAVTVADSSRAAGSSCTESTGVAAPATGSAKISFAACTGASGASGATVAVGSSFKSAGSIVAGATESA